MNIPREPITKFWCADCKASIPAPALRLEARIAQHKAVHEELAAKQEKVTA